MDYAEGQREMSDGTQVFLRRWTPDGRSKGTVLLLHGGAEHSGCYQHVAEKLTTDGYELLGFDLRGFGKTEGKKGHLRHSRVYRDIDELLIEEQQRHKTIFLMGHSMGGQIALLYCLDRHPDIAGVMVTCPGLEIPDKDRRPAQLLKILGLVFPTISATLPIDDRKLIGDTQARERFRADPLVHFRGTFGMARDWFKGLDRAIAEADQFPLPLLLIHADADEVTLSSGSKRFAARHPGDCTLLTPACAYHDLKWEPGWESIFDDAVGWLDGRLPPQGRQRAAKHR